MAKQKPGFMLYFDIAPLIDGMSDADCGKLLKAAFGYSRDGIDAEFTGDLRLVWPYVRGKLDADDAAYRQKSLAAKAKADKRWENDPLPANATACTGIPQDATACTSMPQDATACTSMQMNADDANTTQLQHNTNNIIVPTPDGAGNANKKKGKAFSPESNAYKLASLLADSIAERMPTTERADEKQIQAWALEFDRCRRLDKHQWAEIEDVLIWSQSNTFWQGNILSGGKFRKQYMTLLAQKQREDNHGRV